MCRKLLYFFFMILPLLIGCKHEEYTIPSNGLETSGTQQDELLSLEEDFGTEKGSSLTNNEPSSYRENVYYFERKAKNAGKDTGYSQENPITINDPHYGWVLGRFYIKGFTDKTGYNNEDYFLKKVGDSVVLGFQLQQNIASLNGNNKLSISEDTNGYDEGLQIRKTNFGKGALIITKTDYQNHNEDPMIYVNYLEGVSSGEAETEIELNEEGDYEVVLDYEVKEKKLLGYRYYNYRIVFNIKLRNANCMVFAFDIESHSELLNKSYTAAGFKLDLARSRYLQVKVTREVPNDLGNGLIAGDIRNNSVASDGEEYTEEGIYTIVAFNPFTNVETKKTIYVGFDGVLKAHMLTGEPLYEITNELESGSRLLANGAIVPMSTEVKDYLSYLSEDTTTVEAIEGKQENERVLEVSMSSDSSVVVVNESDEDTKESVETEVDEILFPSQDEGQSFLFILLLVLVVLCSAFVILLDNKNKKR